MAIFGYNGTGASTAGSSANVAVSNTHASTVLTAAAGDTIVSYSIVTGVPSTGSSVTQVGAAAYTYLFNLPSARAFAQTNFPVTAAANTYTSSPVSQGLTAGVLYTVAIQYNADAVNRGACKFDTFPGNVERSTCNGSSLPTNWNNNGTGTTRYLQYATYINGTHASNGTLTGSGATTSGTARRRRAHGSSGVLTGSGSTVSGAAERYVDSIEHGSSGEISGQGSTISGTAQRKRLHIASGALAGSGSTLSSTAARHRPIVIHGNYPRASVNVALSSVEGYGNAAIVKLSPRVSPFGGGVFKWLEISAYVTGVEGITPEFWVQRFNSTDLHLYSEWGTNRRLLFSYDRVNWTDFATGSTVAGSHIVAKHNAPFTQDGVYIARSRQVTNEQFGEFFTTLAATYSFFTPSPTASTFVTSLPDDWPAEEFIAGDFAAQTNELGGAVRATPFYAGLINDESLMPEDGSPKELVILTCGSHAGEDLGDWVMMRDVERLCGSSADALHNRRHFMFLIYGLMNGPGREGGAARGSWDVGLDGNYDNNRGWSHPTGNGFDVVQVARPVIIADRTALIGIRKPAALFDHHGTPKGAFNTYKETDNPADNAFHAYLDTYLTGYTIGDEGDATPGSLSNWAEEDFGINMGLTLELGNPSPIPDSAYTGSSGFAQAFSRALQTAFENGDIAQDNYQTSGVLAGQGSTTSGAAQRRRAHAASGALNGSGSTLSGAATRFTPSVEHETSGALAGQGSTTIGIARRRVTHAVSGALAGSGSTTTGAARRLRSHTASGALAGSGSTVAGSASRSLNIGEHDTSGDLSGSGSTTAGAATRRTRHQSTAALSGSGSTTSGVARRRRIHATSGALTGLGSTLTASALRRVPGARSALGELVGSGASILGYATRRAAEMPVYSSAIDWTATRRMVRKTVHETMGVLGQYHDSINTTPKDIRVRWHSKIDRFGDLAGSQGFGEYVQGIDRLIFNEADARRLGVRENGTLYIPGMNMSFTLVVMEDQEGPYEEIWNVSRVES